LTQTEKDQSNSLVRFFSSLAVLLLVVALAPMIEALQLKTLCMLSIVIATVSWSITISTTPKKALSFSGTYLGVFTIFHFGLAFAYMVGYDIVAARPTHWYYDWFFSPETKTALVLSTKASVAFSTGVCFSTLFRDFQKNRDLSEGFIKPLISEKDFDYNILGFFLTTTSIMAWFIIVIKYGGLATLVSPYMEFLDTTRELPLKFTYYGVGLGMAVAGVGPGTMWRRVCFAIFALWALISFPLGLRGEVLFPLAGAVVVASLRAPAIKLRWLIVSVIVLLFIISAARIVRVSGLGGDLTSTSISSTNPMDALAELGGSLRPVTETVSWINDGESPLNGTSYWAPFERMFQRVIPLWNRVPSVEDQRLLNVLVQRRVGSIGYSPVAEAYYNFKHAGPIVIFFLLGAALGRIDRLRGNIANQLQAAIIIVPLLFNIRNAFSQVPGQLISGVIIVVLYSTIAKTANKLQESKWISM
jgi:oligosaccharide repeat unit polymerase